MMKLAPLQWGLALVWIGLTGCEGGEAGTEVPEGASLSQPNQQIGGRAATTGPAGSEAEAKAILERVQQGTK